MLNRYPVKMIDNVTISTKASISSFLSTFFRIIISGREIALTAIRKARAVPTGSPLPIKLYTTGIIAITLE
jgi:hypothetical protein